jgi:transcriptional regulator with XRE-family HTH domain
VRELRVRRGLVIEDIARKSGLSKPYISQVETGKASPSLQTVRKLAQALGVPLTYLFLEDAFGCHVTRRGERRAVSFGAPDKLVFFLSAPNRSLEMLLLEIPSGYTAGGRTHSHEGEECHWCLTARSRPSRETSGSCWRRGTASTGTAVSPIGSRTTVPRSPGCWWPGHRRVS